MSSYSSPQRLPDHRAAPLQLIPAKAEIRAVAPEAVGGAPAVHGIQHDVNPRRDTPPPLFLGILFPVPKLHCVRKIRPEQMGHKALLRRGRSHKRLQYAFLVVATAAAGIAGLAAMTMTP